MLFFHIHFYWNQNIYLRLHINQCELFIYLFFPLALFRGLVQMCGWAVFIYIYIYTHTLKNIQSITQQTSQILSLGWINSMSVHTAKALIGGRTSSPEEVLFTMHVDGWFGPPAARYCIEVNTARKGWRLSHSSNCLEMCTCEIHVPSVEFHWQGSTVQHGWRWLYNRQRWRQVNCILRKCGVSVADLSVSNCCVCVCLARHHTSC